MTIFRADQSSRPFAADLSRSPLLWLAIIVVIIVNGLHIKSILDTEKQFSTELAARYEEKLKEEYMRLSITGASYSGLFAGSEHVTKAEFRAFSDKLLTEMPHAIQVAYAPRVASSERKVFERRLLLAGAAYPFFHHSSSATDPSPVGEQPYYYPIEYLAFPDATGDMRGALIFGSGSHWLRSLVLNGGRVSSDPFILQWTQVLQVINLFEPLTVDEHGPVGVIAISVNPEMILSSLPLPPGYIMSLSLVDNTGGQAALLWSRGDTSLSDAVPFWRHQRVIRAFNRNLQFVISRQFSLRWGQYLSILALVCLSLVALLLVIMFDRSRSRVLDAQTSNRAKGEFLAMMSHEIRTPLNGVMGLASLLCDADLPDRERKYAEIIVRSGNNLLQIINDLLDYSKIEAGRLDIEKYPFPLDTLITDIRELHVINSGSAVNFSASIAPDCPLTIVTDQNRLRQILQNLLSNAQKFTERGEIVLRIEHKAQGLRFSVSDTGIGMTEEQKRYLFKPYSQVDVSVARRFGGTGLGLSICRKLTEMLGGEIGVQSVYGEGTEFWFTLPSVVTQSDEIDVLPGQFVGLLRKRILIVDGYDTRSQVLSAQCVKLGMVVSVVDRPDDALARIDAPAARPDIIVADYGLGTLEDEYFLRQLQARSGMAAIPVILVAEMLDSKRPASVVTVCPTPVSYRQMAQMLMQQIHPEPSTVATGRRSLRVMVAEDNRVNAMVIGGILSRLGHHYELCVQGRQLLNHLTANHGHYDVVLMDCEMPVLDGYEASVAIRQWETAHHCEPVPIIAITANAVETCRQRCLAVGMNGVISKPVSVEQLKDALVAITAVAS